MPPCLLWLCFIALVHAWIPPSIRLVLQPREIIRQRRSAEHRLLEIRGWVAELKENKAFRAPLQNDCKFYTGRVVGEDTSYVALTDCSGQHYGLIQVQGKEYTMKPQLENNHILERRDVDIDGKEENGKAYNLTEDVVVDLDAKIDEDDLGIKGETGRDIPESENFSSFRDIEAVSRPLSGPVELWLELAVAVDDTMIDFHGKARVNHYVLALMNIVSAIFNDPSLSANMTLVLSRLFLEDDHTVVRPGLAKKSLEAVNRWNYRHLIRLPYDEAGWDAALWLTRADLGGPSGYAPVGGVCERTRSAALVREEGFTSAFVIAHELAHLLGLKHDGDNEGDSDCLSDTRRGSVMAPTVLASLHGYAWSACSRKQFHRHARSWHCMQQRSRDQGVPLGGAAELGRYVFTMEEQCRSEFGEGFSVCTTVRTGPSCERLWCQEDAAPDVCRTKRAPPLDGTPCDSAHWCVNGYCEPISKQLSGNASEKTEDVERAASERDRPTAVPGGWSGWDEWAPCSGPCGYSLRLRNRRCNSPAPSDGGSKCEGTSLEAQVCWTGRACAMWSRDVRADLCSHRDQTLIPYWHSDEYERCNDWCTNIGDGGSTSTYGPLPDGTPCDYTSKHNLCFKGKCIAGVCNEADSDCSWCADGDCNNNTLLYSRRLRKGWTRLAIIPHEARRLELHIASSARLLFAIKERGKPAIKLVSHETERSAYDSVDAQVTEDSSMNEIERSPYDPVDPDVPMNLQVVQVQLQMVQVQEVLPTWYEGRIVAAGTVIRWTSAENKAEFSAEGPLHADILLLASRYERIQRPENKEVMVFFNYSTPVRREPSYSWKVEYGACSRSCGGGVRAARRVCRPAHLCPRAARRAPAATHQQCNTLPCDWRWAAGEWEECSATCGAAGVRGRMLYCLPAGVSAHSRSDLLRSFVSPALCSGEPPSRLQPCNRIPCPVYWHEGDWTSCSRSCGRGWRVRPQLCPAEDAAACGPRPPERRRRCRLRHCPAATTADGDCPRPDVSQYCGVRDLSRACQLPPFANMCCNACRQFLQDNVVFD